MKKVLLVIGFIMIGCVSSYAFELGMIAGEPTGLSAAISLGGQTMACAAAWSFENPTAVHLHVDAIWNLGLLKDSRSHFKTYGGVGGRFKAVDEKPRIGLRLPFGIKAENERIVVFMEIAPIVDLAPASVLRFNAGIGLRYRFR